MSHLAHFYHWFLEVQRLEGVCVLGFSMGGWLAAEMALMCPHRFEKLVLVAAAGIKPSQGEILDIFLHGPEQVAQLAFYDPAQASAYQQLSGAAATPEVAQQNWEMAVRLCWKPYMHNPVLPALLPRLRLPTLIVWGREDRIVPLSCAEAYRQAIRGAVLQVIERCGHVPQLEQPQAFLNAVQQFLAA
jgi:pimeloyl-ACP methyl ester carboxylesterase